MVTAGDYQRVMHSPNDIKCCMLTCSERMHRADSAGAQPDLLQCEFPEMDWRLLLWHADIH